MSLDVYLEAEELFTPAAHRTGIFVRENGRHVELTREQWDAMNPGREPVVAQMPEETTTLFEANITHNLNRMADAAGIYEHLWRPDEIGITMARQLIVPLRDGLARLQAEPARFLPMNPPNGWGTYEILVDFVNRYLAACEQWPDATVRVSR